MRSKDRPKYDRCKNCLKYDKCEIIWKLNEIVGRYLSEKEEIKQPKLTDDFTDIIHNRKEREKALDRSQFRKLKEILEKRDKCFFRRLHIEEKLDCRLFRHRSRTLPINQPTKGNKKRAIKASKCTTHPILFPLETF